MNLLDLKMWVVMPAYALVFLMLVFPMILALSLIKVFLFAVVLATVVVAGVKTGRLGLHPAVAVWTLSLSAISFLFVLEGFFTGAPGAQRTAREYIIWPIIYLACIAGVRYPRVLSGLFGTMVLSTICIAIYSITYTLIQTGVLPESRYFELISFDWDPLAFGLHEGYIAMQFPGLNSLPFLVPFLIAALVTCHPAVCKVLSFRRIWLWPACFLSLATVILSGRRALYLVSLATPLLTVLFASFQPLDERQRSRRALVRVGLLVAIMLITLLIPLNLFYGVTLSGLADRFSLGFNFSATSEDASATERRTQYHALLAGWMENPIFGAGHGSPAYGSIRSQESPWNYELYYLAILYQTGIVGFTAYAAGISWIYWTGVRVIRAGGYLGALMVACLVGMSSILIANATNPYLARYDAMWAIFFPLAVINLGLLRQAAPQTIAVQAR